MEPFDWSIERCMVTILGHMEQLVFDSSFFAIKSEFSSSYLDLIQLTCAFKISVPFFNEEFGTGQHNCSRLDKKETC